MSSVAFSFRECEGRPGARDCGRKRGTNSTSPEVCGSPGDFDREQAEFAGMSPIGPGDHAHDQPKNAVAQPKAAISSSFLSHRRKFCIYAGITFSLHVDLRCPKTLNRRGRGRIVRTYTRRD